MSLRLVSTGSDWVRGTQSTESSWDRNPELSWPGRSPEEKPPICLLHPAPSLREVPPGLTSTFPEQSGNLGSLGASH